MMTIKEAQDKVKELSRQCAYAAMNKDWARARQLNEQSIQLQNEINQRLYWKG